MAKRGRPSKKTLKKRKEAKTKSEHILLLGVILVIAFAILGYFLLTK